MSTPPPPPGGNDDNPYTSDPGAEGSDPSGYGSQGYGSQGYGSQSYGSQGYGSGDEATPSAAGYQAAPGYYGGQPTGDAENNLGIIALVTGIISLIGCAPLGIVAVIYGRKAQTAAAAGRANNGTLGVVGFWLGAVALALMVLAIIFFVVLLGLGISFGSIDS
jgi:MFS family permease